MSLADFRFDFRYDLRTRYLGRRNRIRRALWLPSDDEEALETLLLVFLVEFLVELFVDLFEANEDFSKIFFSSSDWLE